MPTTRVSARARGGWHDVRRRRVHARSPTASAGVVSVVRSWAAPPHAPCSDEDIAGMPWLLQRLARNAVVAITPTTDCPMPRRRIARTPSGAACAARLAVPVVVGRARRLRLDGRQPPAPRRVARRRWSSACGWSARSSAAGSSARAAGQTLRPARPNVRAAAPRRRAVLQEERATRRRRSDHRRERGAAAGARRGSSRSRRSTPRCCCSARPAPARSCSRARCTTAAAAATGRWSASTARRCRRASSRASCSATSAARSPAPSRCGRDASSSPTAARSSSTRSASCAPELQAKLLRVLQEGEFERVGSSKTAPRRRARDRGDARRSRGRRSPTDGSAPTCTTASACFRSRCRRCASAATTSRSSCGTSSSAISATLARRITTVPRRGHAGARRTTTGRATSASSRT